MRHHVRYLFGEYEEMRTRRGIPLETVKKLEMKRSRAAADAGLSEKVIRLSRLSNPFMADHAWKLMLGIALRERGKE